MEVRLEKKSLVLRIDLVGLCSDFAMGTERIGKESPSL